MTDLFVKREGQYEKVDLTLTDCIRWFKDNSDKDGNVLTEAVVFQDCEVKADKEGMAWTLSDETLDRDFERFDSSGWNLKTFKKNPVVLWGHDQNRPAIGKVLNPKVSDGRLVGRIKFSSAEVDPFAGMIEAKIKEGIISAGSVGFKPLNIELVEDEKDPCNLIYRKQELREFSICNVPANPNALFNPEKSEAEELGIPESTLQEFYKEEEIYNRLDEIEKDVEALKTMQMKQADVKQESTYFDKLFVKGEESKNQRLNKLFPEK